MARTITEENKKYINEIVLKDIVKRSEEQWTAIRSGKTDRTVETFLEEDLGSSEASKRQEE